MKNNISLSKELSRLHELFLFNYISIVVDVYKHTVEISVFLECSHNHDCSSNELLKILYKFFISKYPFKRIFLTIKKDKKHFF